MDEQTYTVVFGPTWHECMIKINHDHVFENVRPGEDWTMEQAMKEMILFWSNGDDRLDMNDGDVTKTFLQQLAREICYIRVEFNYNLTGVIDAFKNREGWWPMDGSCGITILEVDETDLFGHNEFEVFQGEAGRRTRDDQ